MPKAVTSLTGYIRKIEQMDRAATGALFFRGHPDISYKLMPSVFRDNNIRENEKSIIYRAMSESPKEFDNDKYFFDKLVRAQHYGIPTRLLDLTINPLIALYFACEKAPGVRAQVVALEVPKNETKFFLSDAVSCKSNLAQLTRPEIEALRAAVIASCEKKLGKGFKRRKLLTWRSAEPEKWQGVIEEFNLDPVVRRLVQFVREEKPHFQEIIDPIDVIKPDIVFPKKNNARISSQSGAFLVYGINTLLSDTLAARQSIKKYVIDIASAQKEDILRALSSIGISENFVYPEFERAAAQIRKLYS